MVQSYPFFEVYGTVDQAADQEYPGPGVPTDGRAAEPKLHESGVGEQQLQTDHGRYDQQQPAVSARSAATECAET